MSVTLNDLLTGDFNATITDTSGMEYDPANDGNFADWLANSGGVDQYDTDYEGLSTSYDTGTGVNLHELELGGANPDFMNSGNLTLLEVLGASGFSDQPLTFSDEGSGTDILYGGSLNLDEQSGVEQFMAEGGELYSFLQGGPDLGFAGEDDATGEGIIGKFELREKQAYDAFNRKIEAGGTTLETDIAKLEDNYDDAIEEANLNKRESMSSLRQQEASRADSLVNSLVSSGRQSGRGVRGGGKSKKLALQAQLDALQGLKSESKLARQTASEAMEAAAFTYGTWENGTRIGEAGTAEQGLNTAYNIMASDELFALRSDIDSAQIDFAMEAEAAYDDWYMDISSRLLDSAGTEYGTGDAIFDPFNTSGAYDENTDNSGNDINDNTTSNSFSGGGGGSSGDKFGMDEEDYGTTIVEENEGGGTAGGY